MRFKGGWRLGDARRSLFLRVISRGELRQDRPTIEEPTMADETRKTSELADKELDAAVGGAGEPLPLPIPTPMPTPGPVPLPYPNISGSASTAASRRRG
jgi:hypothetical protein